jgi:hypothetical protein
MSNEYERNHYVPRGYLKGFTNNENKIFRLLLNPNEYQTPIKKFSINQVGYEWDLYTIIDERFFQLYNIPKDDKFIEKKCFKEIETNIGKAIDNILNKKLGKDDRTLICDFILISITRNPKNMEFFKKNYNSKLHEDFLDKNKDVIEDSRKFYRDNRSFDEMKKDYLKMIKESENFKVENLAKSFLHQILLDLALNPNNLRKQKFKHNIWRQFTIYESPEDVEFITSNHPANSYENGLGFNNNLLPSSSYTIPLSKNMMLEIDGKPWSPEFYPLPIWMKIDNNMADYMNYITIVNSQGEIYGSSQEQLERYNTEEYQELHLQRFKHEELMRTYKNRT